MKRLLIIVILLCGALAWAEGGAHTFVVLPFENASKAPGLQWIGESFPDVVSQRLASPKLFMVSRDDRVYAFDRAGIPTNVRPSRATLYRIAEQMDVDYVVLGKYTFDGERFAATAQVLDVKAPHLSQELVESGPLLKLLDIENALAWQVLRVLNPTYPVSKERFVLAAPSIRLDAFEAYIRGITTTTRQEKIQRFRDAVRLNPNYYQAMFQLGRAYFAGREYDSAASWFSRIPKSEAVAREANFFAGLSYYYLGQFDKAANAFNFLTGELPLIEVYNNLGVVEARKGKRDAIEYFQKAVQTDPSDPDYRFNLALALYRASDTQGAMRELRECLKQKPSDTEAKALLDTLQHIASRPSDSSSARARIPVERIKRNYDESSFRQLALEIENAQESRLAKLPAPQHAGFHIERGRELLAQGFAAEAEKEFRDAIALDPTSAEAHTGLAQVLENDDNSEAARREAQMALRLKPTAAAYLVLANLDLKENKFEAANDNITRALGLEPNNAAAQALQREVTAKQQQGSMATPQSK